MECSFGPCTRTSDTHKIVAGLCLGHYAQRNRGKELTELEPRIRRRSDEEIRFRDAEGRKQCTNCDGWFPETEFHPRADKADGLYPHCKTCRSAEYVRKTAERREAATAELLKLQDGKCAICETQITKETAQIDHDHSCCPYKQSCEKCIRGLLCRSCNLGLGRFGDSIPRMKAAIRYLESRAL